MKKVDFVTSFRDNLRFLFEDFPSESFQRKPYLRKHRASLQTKQLSTTLSRFDQVSATPPFDFYFPSGWILSIYKTELTCHLSGNLALK